MKGLRFKIKDLRFRLGLPLRFKIRIKIKREILRERLQIKD